MIKIIERVILFIKYTKCVYKVQTNYHVNLQTSCVMRMLETKYQTISNHVRVKKQYSNMEVRTTRHLQHLRRFPKKAIPTRRDQTCVTSGQDTYFGDTGSKDGKGAQLMNRSLHEVELAHVHDRCPHRPSCDSHARDRGCANHTRRRQRPRAQARTIARNQSRAAQS